MEEENKKQEEKEMKENEISNVEVTKEIVMEKKDDAKELKESLHKEKKVGSEIKKDEKKTSKKVEVKRPKKTEAFVKGLDLHISTKQSMALCRFVKGKTTQQAIKDLEQVIKIKKVVPMKGEIPHRHGKGIMSGRYPVNASGVFIKLIKTLEGNARVNGLGENPKITYASASIASRPYGRFGEHRKKRTYLLLGTKIQPEKNKLEIKSNQNKIENKKLEVGK